jgi:DNA repair exonuclease SbcCD nuclease subunit
VRENKILIFLINIFMEEEIKGEIRFLKERHPQRFKAFEESLGISIEQGIEKYKKYFDILRKNDIPMINSFPRPNEIPNELSQYKTINKNGITTFEKMENKKKRVEEFFKRIDSQKKCLDFIKSLYDKIDIEIQNKDTGKEILRENKEILSDYYTLYNQTLQKAKMSLGKNFIIPEELSKMAQKILENSIKYGNLPAIMTYENIGRIGTIPKNMTRDEWFRNGKPTPKEWFEKWSFKSDND